MRQTSLFSRQGTHEQSPRAPARPPLPPARPTRLAPPHSLRPGPARPRLELVPVRRLQAVAQRLELAGAPQLSRPHLMVVDDPQAVLRGHVHERLLRPQLGPG